MSRTGQRWMLVVLLLALVGEACAAGGAEGPADVARTSLGEEVELPASGACGDAYFWAATVAGDIAVTLRIDARERAADETTTIPISLPDPDVTVEVLRGENLAANFCTDLINTAFEPATRQPVTDGVGEVLLEPSATSDPPSCGDTLGTLSLAGLVAKDGTTFAPIEVSSRSIGCYAG